MNIYIVCTDKQNLLQAFPMSSFLFFIIVFCLLILIWRPCDSRKGWIRVQQPQCKWANWMDTSLFAKSSADENIFNNLSATFSQQKRPDWGTFWISPLWSHLFQVSLVPRCHNFPSKPYLMTNICLIKKNLVVILFSNKETCFAFLYLLQKSHPSVI